MANLMLAPRYVAVDGDGLAMAGAKLYFYVTGTSTPKDVYTTSGAGTAFSQPVEADADGLFPAIFLGSGDYKVILTTSADVTVWTTDPMSGTSATDTLTTRGDLLTRDASGYTRLAIGTSGYILRSNGLQPEWGRELVPYSSIQGLTYSNNGSDATNDIDIAMGAAMDGSNAKMLVLGSALTKRLDAAWAVGTNQGGLDTGSIADTDYFIWLIYRSDTEVVDVLFSTSATAPTMPTSYNYKRLIGWFKRASAAIVAFKTYETAGGGLKMQWAVPRLDVNLATTLTTTRRTDPLSVPLNFATEARINVSVRHGSTPFVAWVYCPDQTDSAPSDTAAPLANVSYGADNPLTVALDVLTDATGKIAARASSANVALYAVATVGFTWARR